jgi:hypothetical protein
MVVRSAEPVQAKQPSGWARFMNMLFPGRFYREEFAAHAQESYLRDETVTAVRAAKAVNEAQAYEDAKNAVVRENRKKPSSTKPTPFSRTCR